MSKQRKGGRRFTVFGTDIDKKSVVVTPRTQQSLPYVSDHIVEQLHDMTEDIMDLATMQMDFSGRQPYRLKRPVRLASSEMLREWDNRLEHRRLREQSAGATFSRELPRSPASPDSPRNRGLSPRNATYGAYQHAKRGHVRQADFSYQLKEEEKDEEEFNKSANIGSHVDSLPTLQQRLEERRRNKPMRASIMKRPGKLDEATQQNGPLIIGDYHLDSEGKVPVRTIRQTKMMNPATGKNTDTSETAKTVEGVYVGGTKNKRHYMEKMSWFKASKKYRPDNIKDRTNETIEKYLSLEHVYGFRGQDTRNNLSYTGDGEILFTAAALGIVVDPTTNKQQFMSEHSDDIISIATSDVKKKRRAFSYVATGEIGRNPKIIVWESRGMTSLQTLSGVHQRGVSQLSFSPSGLLLASVGLDILNTLVLHEWKTGVMLHKVQTGEDQVYGLSFQPDIALPLDDTRLVTCGKRHLTFWNRKEEDKLKKRSAKFGKLGRKVSVVDVCFDFAGRCIGATSLGHLGVWPPKDNDSTMLPLNNGSIKDAHNGPINCVETVPGGNKIVSGGVDGMIKVWNCPNDLHHRIELYRSFDTIKKIERIPSIQSISVAGNKGEIALLVVAGSV
jgi:WD40 repeat protein